jgi:GT2 family glycosyltransferase
MPQSWELVQQRQNKTLIGIVIAPPLMVSIDWALALKNLQTPPIYDVMRVTGLPWGEARTQIAYQCLNAGYEWLFFLDADVILPPDALMRLLSYRLPICSALYHQKFPTWTGMEVKYMPAIFNEGRDAQGNPTRVEVNFQYGQMVEVAYAPAGAMLIHRSVFERFLAAGIKRFYEWTLHAENPSAGKSEDFEWAARARSLGYKIMVDTGIQAIHEAQAKVDIRGISPKI